ncbi:hypothetical protein ASE92_10580 [Pedobacter sp. Leaf41]|nr:hypothetical protein ASE92_10580 [Pedobacter sp. Leaf41]
MDRNSIFHLLKRILIPIITFGILLVFILILNPNLFDVSPRHKHELVPSNTSLILNLLAFFYVLYLAVEMVLLFVKNKKTLAVCNFFILVLFAISSLMFLNF